MFGYSGCLRMRRTLAWPCGFSSFSPFTTNLGRIEFGFELFGVFLAARTMHVTGLAHSAPYCRCMSARPEFYAFGTCAP
eukprot:5306186-Alexandrium_andersonii.AAC.1